MTPLGASLAFIIVSIIISTIKHFIFPSNNPSTSEESSIELKKLYTITDKKSQKINKSYGSFYEAYHQFHISQVEQRKLRIEQNFMLEYNSLVMKKSIINDESIIICDQNYLVSVEEGFSCNNLQGSVNQNACEWQTTFNVYQLPLLKQQTKQSIKVKGQIKNSQKSQKSGQKGNNLECKKLQQNKYFISFLLATKSIKSDDYFWTLNKLQIQTTQKVQAKQSEKNLSKKGKKLEAKSYDIPKISGKIHKPSNGTFELRHEIIDLQKSYHQPTVYSLTSKGVCYSTLSDPWLIRCKKNQNQNWEHMNIMQKQIQKKIFKGFTLSSRTPPFQRLQKINVKYLFLFETQQGIYQEGCQESRCLQRVNETRKHFVTVVYEHLNNPYRVEKFYVQLTFQLFKQTVKQVDIQKSPKLLSNLKSYSFLISQINPSRVIYSDCSMKLKRERIHERYYDKYYWLYEDKVIANVDVYSLLCVFRFDIDQHLRVTQIADIVRSVQKNNFYELLFVDWKNLKKIINYKENFQIYLKKKLNLQTNENLTTRNKTQFVIKKKEQNQDNDNQNLIQEQSPNEMQQYFDIIKQEFQAYQDQNLITQNITQKQFMLKQKQKQNQKPQAKTKTKKKSNNKNNNKYTQKKSKSTKKSLKKKKTLNKISKKQLFQYEFTPLEGIHKPTIQNSYNYSFYRQSVPDPIRTQVRKYKFPLPFLLSFTQNMEIVNSQPNKPLILFSGVKQYLFTYRLKQVQTDSNTILQKVVDYRYLTLGPTYQHTSKLFTPSQGTPQHQIKTSKQVIDQISQKTIQNPNQKLNIQIKDQTHPEIENVIKTIQQSGQKILHQIKSIKSVPVVYKKPKRTNNQSIEPIQTYQKYLIVVWGWGIEVYLVDWDKNGFFRQNITQQEIQLKLSQKNKSIIEYFLPFIELFTTFYCMFQALISSR